MQRQSIAAFFQNLTHLNLVSCHADDEMIETICLHAKKNLYALRIQEGLVTDQGLAMIAEAYGESQHFSSSSASSFLRILVLTDIHTITTRGCVAMLEKIGPQLFSLGLASTRASTEIDCQLIDALIQYCTSLLTLDVSVPLSDPIIINHQFSSNKQKQILETFVKTMVSRLKWIRLMGWAGDGSFMKRFGDLVIRGHHCLDDSIE